MREVLLSGAWTSRVLVISCHHPSVDSVVWVVTWIAQSWYAQMLAVERTPHDSSVSWYISFEVQWTFQKMVVGESNDADFNRWSWWNTGCDHNVEFTSHSACAGMNNWTCRSISTAASAPAKSRDGVSPNSSQIKVEVTGDEIVTDADRRLACLLHGSVYCLIL